MAGNKTFTELTTLATVDKDNDWMAVVDVSDTSASVYGTTKKANPILLSLMLIESLY